jgi:hypothetical protein
MVVEQDTLPFHRFDTRVIIMPRLRLGDNELLRFCMQDVTEELHTKIYMDSVDVVTRAERAAIRRVRPYTTMVTNAAIAADSTTAAAALVCSLACSGRVYTWCFVWALD